MMPPFCMDTPDAQNSLIAALIYYFVQATGRVKGRIRLMKLVYLTDVMAAKIVGRTTGARWFRYTHGPMSRDVYEAIAAMNNRVIAEIPGEGFSGERFDFVPIFDEPANEPPLLEDHDFIVFANRVMQEWADKPIKELLDAVYATEPFKSTEMKEDIDFSKLFPPKGMPREENEVERNFRKILEKFENNTADVH